MRKLLDTMSLLSTILVMKVVEVLIRVFSRQGRTDIFDNRDFPWTSTLSADSPLIRRELDGVLATRSAIPNLQDVDEMSRNLSQDDRWKSYFLFLCGEPIEANCATCPATVRALERVPGLQTAFFSILAPGKTIPEHRGLYVGFIRCHLGLRVPRDADRCRITINGRDVVWKEGEAFVFDDTFRHSVENDTPDERVVLILDFERPLAFPLKPLNRLVLRLLGRSSVVQKPIRFLRGHAYH